MPRLLSTASLLLSVAAAAAFACSSGATHGTGSGHDAGSAPLPPNADASAPSGDSGGEVSDAASLPDVALAPDGGPYDPYAPQPDTSQGLTNVATDLGALLENGALSGASRSTRPARPIRRRRCSAASGSSSTTRSGRPASPPPSCSSWRRASPTSSASRSRSSG